jgi:hypothetical protein
VTPSGARIVTCLDVCGEKLSTSACEVGTVNPVARQNRGKSPSPEPGDRLFLPFRCCRERSCSRYATRVPHGRHLTDKQGISHDARHR